MSWAAARVAVAEGSGIALALWALQIALNTLWTPIFFGPHRMRTGLVIIALLWASVIATTLAFFQIDTLAGVMSVPYVAWVSVAACLNYSILQLNPGRVSANSAS
ncbi:TspO/MBR family protein [Aliiruegeria lutimaris]|uniref:TspO/MBR family protein n=1 Tax=Aliiruegeria lutimaris TaxID=571298 RepID=UPI000B840F75